MLPRGSDTMKVPFENRSEQIFGREADLQWLLQRAHEPGLTVLVGRPLMGKTWTMLELARRLIEHGPYLVGYHEYKGGEASHLLYAVANLYENWLNDSTMLQQAVSLWQQYKDQLVPRVAKFVGPLFSEVIKARGAPGAVGEAVKAAFDRLADAATQLKTGGLDLPALPYDQARSLVHLVATVSKRRPMLMLDGWEKSGAQRDEYTTLQSFLKHTDQWNGTHLFLTLREALLPGEHDNLSLQYVEDLQRYSRRVAIRPLAVMDLQDRHEVARMGQFLRLRIPAASGVTDVRFCQLISGYPGVIDFWLHAAERSEVQSSADLETLAQQAQSNLYAELEGLLGALSDSERDFASQLAVLPRLNAFTWRVLRPILPVQSDALTLDRLLNRGLLEPGDGPHFGHDTRHRAVRQSFARLFRHSFTELAEQTVAGLAAHCTNTNQRAPTCLQSLAASHELTEFITFDPRLDCLVSAARSVFRDDQGICSDQFMSAHRVAAKLSPGATSLVSMGLLHRALRLARDEDGTRSGLVELEAALALPGIPDWSVSMALYNRGIIRGGQGDFSGAMKDCTAVLEMEATPPEFRARAQYNLGNSRRQQGDIDGALKEFTAVISQAECPAEPRTKALIARGEIAEEQENFASALADYTAALEVTGISVNELTWAYCKRGRVHKEQGNQAAAHADFEAVIQRADAPAREVATALSHRAALRMEGGEISQARDDIDAILLLNEVTPYRRAAALYNRGTIKELQGDIAGALSDYAAVIELPDAPVDFLAMAWINCGVIQYERGDYVDSLGAYTAALRLPEISAEHRALARRNCGVVNDLLGNVEGALKDYTSVIETPGAPASEIAVSLYNRAEIRARQNDLAAACKDVRRCMDLHGAPDVVIVKARHLYRSWNCASDSGG